MGHMVCRVKQQEECIRCAHCALYPGSERGGLSVDRMTDEHRSRKPTYKRINVLTPGEWGSTNATLVVRDDGRLQHVLHKVLQ